MSKVVGLTYGVFAYLLFVFTFLYAIGFVGNWFVPKSIDGRQTSPTGVSIAINVALLSVFAVQHTIMARPAFKSWWTTIIPRPVERSTFVLAASLSLLLIFWLWRPLPTIVWQVSQPWMASLLATVSLAGWGIVFYASFLISHFDLFGLRQVTLHYRDQPYEPPAFATRSLYRWIRHPLMAGFLIAFWATPVMTQGHLLFAVVTTGYIFFGIWIEERDLLQSLGPDYARYRSETSMILPWSKRRRPDTAAP